MKLQSLIFLILIGSTNLVFAEKTSLVCTGSITLSTSKMKDLISLDKEFEFTFDDKKGVVSYTGIRFCEGLISHSVDIKENLITYHCEGKPNDKEWSLTKHSANLTLNRYTGKMTYNSFGEGKDFTSYETGNYNCEKAKRKF